MLLKAVALISVIRLALWVFPFGTVLRRLARWSAKNGPTSVDRAYVRRVVWAVTTAGRYLLGDKPCLPTALAAQWFLRQKAFPSDLHIGVRKEEDGTLQAHAWVTSKGGVVIVGGIDAPMRYTPLPSLDLNRL